MIRRFRTVPDTNVIISSQLNPSEHSPNAEYLDRWTQGQFDLLYSTDTLREYVRKLKEHSVPREQIKTFVKQLRNAELILIEYYHHSSDKYPPDPDDIVFILCADNGKATHVISYDDHLLELAGKHPFTICKPVAFLKELRASL